MARSGTGSHFLRTSALYDGTTKYGSANPLHSAYTVHVFARSTAAPAQNTVRSCTEIVGDNTSNPQRPQNIIVWDHTSAGFPHSVFNRNAAGTYEIAQGTTVYSANTWYSIGQVFNSSTIKIFVNGIQENSATASVSQNKTIWLSILGQVLSTGATESSGQFSDGQVAEVAFWNAALSADDMNALSKGFSPLLVRPQSLFSYVPLVRPTMDFMGNVTWNEINSPTQTDHPRVFSI